MTPASETTLPQRQLPSGKQRSSRNKNALTPKPVTELTTLGATCEQWFKNRNQRPFDFQRETWQAMGAGRNGLLHAPTGTGKTLAAWFGALCRSSALPTHDKKQASELSGSLHYVLWQRIPPVLLKSHWST